MGRKLALIIGNSDYQDTRLAKLVKPDNDAAGFASVLRDSEIGGFDGVTTLLNEPEARLRREIARFFAQKSRDDLLLLYFSGHGVLDELGSLYFAVRDTEHDSLNATAIPANFIRQEMDRSNSRRQVLILDCCNSGAFGRGAKGPGDSVGAAAVFDVTGYGRGVMTATDSIQFAWESDQFIGEADYSVFTHFLIEGLKTGAADSEGDGLITLDELYEYVYAKVRNATPKQTPTLSLDKQAGPIIIARNPRPVVKPLPLPLELQQTIEDPRPWVRESAVRELDQMLRSNRPGLVLAAKEALGRLGDDDSRKVSSLAAASLAAFEEAQRAKEAERERAETERLARQKAEEERKAREQENAELLARQRAEEERLERARAEAERLIREKEEQERIAKEKAEVERLAREKEEQERLAREKAEAEGVAREKAEEERKARERESAELLARQRAKEERLEHDRAEAGRLIREKEEQEQTAREAERARQERLARERAEAERAAQAKAEQERIAKAEAERPARGAERAEQERLAFEQAERERWAKEEAGRTGPARLAFWQPALAATVGWGVAAMLGVTAAFNIYGALGSALALNNTPPDSVSRPIIAIVGFLVGGAIAGLIGGAGTGLAWRWANPAGRWTHVIGIALGWMAALAIGWAVAIAVSDFNFLYDKIPDLPQAQNSAVKVLAVLAPSADFSMMGEEKVGVQFLIGLALGAVLAGGIGGVLTGTALRRANALSWPQAFLAAGCWAVGFLAPAIVAALSFAANVNNDTLFNNTFLGLLASGLIGSLATFWMIGRGEKRPDNP